MTRFRGLLSFVGVTTYVLLAFASSTSAPITPDWGIGMAAGLGGVVGAYLGASAQARVPETTLRRLLGGLALLIAMRYL